MKSIRIDFYANNGGATTVFYVYKVDGVPRSYKTELVSAGSMTCDPDSAREQLLADIEEGFMSGQPE